MARKTQRTKKIVVVRDCPFCKSDKEPSYKDYETLKNYLTKRSRIVGKGRSGLCSKHQRKLTREIKRARHLALLPFSPEF